MSAQTSSSREVPASIDSPRAKLVYLYLDASEGATVEEMQHDLDMPKISLLSLLQALAAQDLVGRGDGRYVCQ
ncbi:MarR family transcriptional regulator [Halosolutus gelatinilyticus]|uniref:MarR family transcriptional regulator n=1 Tax=Halosolutus gelatinilyticus TaxID=2931975 RepID=UPI001FF33281|nr:MarR family transcriptional regulator [Halosolutus gelatinilyticus]